MSKGSLVFGKCSILIIYLIMSHAVANPEILKGGLISSFLSSSSPSSSSFLLQNEGGAKGGLHGVFGSRGGWSPPRPTAASATVLKGVETWKKDNSLKR